jgi:hypothetical protein
MYIRCSCCYMFRPHLDRHKAIFIIWGDRCAVHFVLCALRHIVIFVVDFLRRIF